jgi:transposase
LARNHPVRSISELERRYASDLTDAEWRLIEPYMPAVKRLGRPRETDLRAIIALTGCQRRLLPKDFPPFTVVQAYFYDWRDQGLFERIYFELLLQPRETAGRNPVPLLASSTANRLRPPKAADHEAMMQPRKSKVVSAISGPALPAC